MTISEDPHWIRPCSLHTTLVYYPVKCSQISKMYAGCIKWFRQSKDLGASTYLPIYVHRFQVCAFDSSLVDMHSLHVRLYLHTLMEWLLTMSTSDSQSSVCTQTMKWKLHFLEEEYFGPVERGPVECEAWLFATTTVRMTSNRWKVKQFALPWEMEVCFENPDRDTN